MPIVPKIPKKNYVTKICNQCGFTLPVESFAQTHSPFYPDGYLPICNDCVGVYLKEQEYSWEAIDRLCQYAGIPWIVKEWERLKDINGVEKTWPVYARVFASDTYKSLGWADYDAQYRKLREAGMIEEEIPLLNEARLNDMRRRWGANYDEDELTYLEDLYKGLLASQNINGDLQVDQARKLCKISLEIDARIRAGDKEVDKFLASYDKLVKIAEFTPKNTKNAVDFDSFAEVGKWLEKRGHQNKFYDNVTRDVIDETLKNIENYNQRLYVNEGGIGDEISNRLKMLKTAEDNEESYFGLAKEFADDEYDNAGFTMEEEEFEVEGGEGDV